MSGKKIQTKVEMSESHQKLAVGGYSLFPKIWVFPYYIILKDQHTCLLMIHVSKLNTARKQCTNNDCMKGDMPIPIYNLKMQGWYMWYCPVLWYDTNCNCKESCDLFATHPPVKKNLVHYNSDKTSQNLIDKNWQ